MEPNPALTRPPVGETALIRNPNLRHELTDRRETDCRTALTRGLCEYLRTLESPWIGGRLTRLVNVFHTWSAPEVVAEFPSCAVYATGLGEYEAATLAQATAFIPDTRYAARKAAEYKVPLRAECWVTNPQDRMAVGSMLENAFDPVDWMAGFRLHLPHYHGCVGTFLATDNDYRDAEDTDRQRVLLITFDLIAAVDKISFVGELPPFRPSAELAVDDGTGTDPQPKRVGSRS